MARVTESEASDACCSTAPGATCVFEPSLPYSVCVVSSSTNAVVPTTVIDRSSSAPIPSSPRDDFSTVLPSSPGPYERSTPSSADTA